MKKMINIFGNMMTSAKHPLKVLGTGKGRYALFTVASKRYYDSVKQEEITDFFPLITAFSFQPKVLRMIKPGGRVLVNAEVSTRKNEDNHSVLTLRAIDIIPIDYDEVVMAKMAKAKAKAKTDAENIAPYETVVEETQEPVLESVVKKTTKAKTKTTTTIAADDDFICDKCGKDFDECECK